MKRRSVLAGVGGGLAATISAATSGCLGVRSGVVGTSVEHVDPRRVRKRRDTIVAFDDGDREVRVLGFVYYGSSSCNRVGFDTVAYDAEAGHLRVALASTDEKPVSLGCTGDVAATWYRATVRFADDLPGRVTVVESGGGEEATVRTVDRSEQRERCTTDHPEGSNASGLAHWTCPERYVAAERSTGATTPDDE